jgi:hypothetical protein
MAKLMLRLPLTALVLGIGLLLAAVNAGGAPAEAGVASESPSVEQETACPDGEEAIPVAENLLPAKRPADFGGRYRSEAPRTLEPTFVETLRLDPAQLEILRSSPRLLPQAPAPETIAVPPSEDPARS